MLGRLLSSFGLSFLFCLVDSFLGREGVVMRTQKDRPTRATEWDLVSKHKVAKDTENASPILPHAPPI